jgi:predicted AAA+ superfamily ATPase
LKYPKLLLDGARVYIPRHIESSVLERAREKGAVIVTGARQVGKSTLIEKLKPDIPKVTFDDTLLKNSAKADPATFLALNPPPVFIDEVQYAPEIFSYIKMSLDSSRLKGEFFLTGSESFELMQNVAESLAGRAAILELLGLSLREIGRESPRDPFLPTLDRLSALEQTQVGADQDIRALWRIIHRGCLPELTANPDYDWANYYADYLKTYIERDVRRLVQVADETLFVTFMRVCAAMTGQLLNLASLAKDVGVSQPTAKRWLSILRSSGLVYLLQPYSNNAISRAVRTPKLHFLDLGLAAYLTRWLTPETLMSGAAAGSFFESFVVGEILKSYWNNGDEVDLYFIRDSNQKEIDLVLHQNNTLYPIEIKVTAAPNTRIGRNFDMLKKIKDVHVGPGAVICTAARITPLADNCFVIPVWKI